MFNSFNAHVVTRAHSTIAFKLAEGTLSFADADDQLHTFDLNEGYTENRIHDAVTRYSDYAHLEATADARYDDISSNWDDWEL
jgi:hypothetical protein